MEVINIIHCPISEVGSRLKELSSFAEGTPSASLRSAPYPGKWSAAGIPSAAKLQLFIVCDRNIRELAEMIGVEADGIFEIYATEGNKDIATVVDINRWLMEKGADREALLLGIGGGITTDMTGFAASVYKRGIRFAFVPTTLLSQVDAAIGGKTGVNLDSYKNMIGIIRQPEAVFICPEPLETLPYSQIVSGAAELLKTFIIDNSKGLYQKAMETLSNIREAGGDISGYSKSLNSLIAEAALVKAGIAGRDPFEKGERRLLNLGHTFAHAIEKMSEEKISHGEAVSMGMVMAARVSEIKRLAKKGFANSLKADFEACGMAVDCPFKVRELTNAMRKDKKAQGNIVHFVLPFGIGHVETVDLSPDEVANLLEE
ncbi:MAG: 3-dehydroquinate synthase [Bacteroidales bacterium]|nr:3-dehydroquinate synthase [Bacteroidales bacterium]